jgi:hypothetical protein
VAENFNVTTRTHTSQYSHYFLRELQAALRLRRITVTDPSYYPTVEGVTR